MKRQSRLSATLAVFFIIFMLSDICCMSSCAGELDDLHGFGTVSFTIDATDRSTPAIHTADAGQQHESQSNNCNDDGCFCSGHILQTLPLSVANVDVASVVNGSQDASLPTSPPRTLFHPPRFS
jgi:hypothetical protein